MNLQRYLIILLVFVSMVSTAGADSYDNLHHDDNWKLVSNDNGFTVYNRKVQDSKILAVKIQGILKAPITHLMSILREVETQPEWTPDLTVKFTIDDKSDLEAITYSLNNMPWPLSDRDMILHNELKLDKKRKLLFVLMKSIELEKYPRKDGIVRAHIEYANLGIRPETENTTYCELTIFADPKGMIPSWIVNFYQGTWPMDYLYAIEKRAIEKKQPIKRKGLKKILRQLLKIIDKKIDIAINK